MPRGTRGRTGELGGRAASSESAGVSRRTSGEPLAPRPESIRSLLARHAIRPSRRLGQSFLTQPGIAERIARAAEIPRGASVIEIGPGLGILTRALAPLARKVAAIEVDHRLARILRAEGDLPPNVEVIEADALDVDYDALARRLGGPVLVVANLPYAISTPLVFRLLECRGAVHWWVLMLQREVGDRLVAAPGSKDYGALTVGIRLFADVKRLFTVGPSNFHPRPEVASVVLRFDLLEAPRIPLEDPGVFSRVVRDAFGRRRKTLSNALSSLVAETGPGPFAAAGIDPRCRGETLSPEEFAHLANAFARAGARGEPTPTPRGRG